jgi:hypothetical protein
VWANAGEVAADGIDNDGNGKQSLQVFSYMRLNNIAVSNMCAVIKLLLLPNSLLKTAACC